MTLSKQHSKKAKTVEVERNYKMFANLKKGRLKNIWIRVDGA